MKIGRFWRVGALTVLLAWSLACFALAAPDPNFVVADPNVLMGTLPNGLRYAISQHPSHQRESIRFYVAAGSLDETDREQGVAHYLEHMAFNGSRSIAPGTLISKFEAAGIAFGRDQNASTSYFGTDYTLNIPNVTSEKIALAFTWLRDVADGLSLANNEVERERGVVMSEYTLGLGAQKTINEEFQRYLTPQLRTVDRPPIGQRETIAAMDAGTLRAFYERWYRPQNAILVIAGDEPVAEMKARIESTFSTWTNSSPIQPRNPIGWVDLKRTGDTKSLFEPHASTGVTICRFTAKPPHRPEDVQVTRARIADQMWQTVFWRRMAKREREENAPFLSAASTYNIYERTIGQTCFSARAKLDDWRSALLGLSDEIKRLETYGITQAEYDYARTIILANADQAIASDESRTAVTTADAILSNIIEGDTFDTVQESKRVTLLALAELNPLAIKTAFSERWAQAAPPLVAVLTSKPYTAGDLAETWALASKTPPPAAPTDDVAVVWHYGDAAHPGRVVSTEILKDPDFKRVTFANGVVLNLKRTTYSKDTIEIRISFGYGQAEAPPGKLTALSLAGRSLFSGGYSQNDLTDVTQICEGKRCNATLQVGRDRFDLYGSTRPQDISLELQILTGLLTDAGFRPNMVAELPTVAANFYRGYKINPALQATLLRDKSLPLPHVADLPPEAEISGLKASDFKSLLQPALRQSPLEVTIVGDLEEDDIIAKVAATLGALPKRQDVDRARPDAVHVRFADAAPPPQTAYHEGPKEQAVVLLTWPLFVWTPARIHETRVVSLLTRIMQDAVTERLRQKLGKTYSPSVSLTLARGGDQGALILLAQTTPDASAMVEKEALAIARELSAGSISEDQLDRARRPMIESAAKRKTYNSWWLNTLDGSMRYPDQLEAARTWDEEIARISLTEVKAEARRWLSSEPYIDISLPAGQSPIIATPENAYKH